MRNHVQWRRLIIATAGFVAVVVAGALTASRLRAQGPATRPPTPQWQIDAGGNRTFEVASVKQNTGGQSASTMHSNIPLGSRQSAQDNLAPTGRLFSAGNFPLMAYLTFAYDLSPYQIKAVQSQLPKWANAERFDIEARAQGNPTKDQFRLMMQSLLTDRFKLAIRYENRQLPVLGLVLSKPGVTGPQLRRHSPDPPCAAPASGSPLTPAATGGFPPVCNRLVGERLVSGQWRVSARDMSMGTIADDLLAVGNLDRPVLDQTGLSGEFDFWMEFTLEAGGPAANAQPDSSGTTFLEALQEQLGLKLESETGSATMLIIDHVEEPSPN
jgi:uncharacterized protein (TIGR03435 family)